MNAPFPKQSAQVAQNYLKSRVMTATPEQLQMMLFDGAVRFCELARTALMAGDFENTYHNVSKAQRIVTELIGNLMHDRSPELCGKLSSIYSYVYKLLFEASSKHNVESLDVAIKQMQFQRETWVLLMQDLGKQKAATAAATMDIPEPSTRMERSVSFSA